MPIVRLIACGRYQSDNDGTIPATAAAAASAAAAAAAGPLPLPLLSCCYGHSPYQDSGFQRV